MSALRLKLQHPEAGDVRFTLGSKPMILGRDKGLDVEMAWDVKVSRRHARVWREGDEIWFEDLQSTNGSWLGKQRLDRPLLLGPDVRVQMGETVLTRLDEVELPELDTADLDGMTIQMSADARFPGIDELVRKTASERVASFLAALHEIAGSLLHSTGEEMLGRALRKIFEVVPAAQRISLVGWPPNEEGRHEVLVAEDVLAVSGRSRAAISKGLASAAAEHRKAILFFHEDSHADVNPTASMVMHGIRSAVYVPLLEAEGPVSAMLCVDTPRPSTPFQSEDFQFIRAVADLLAAALSADRLRKESQRKEMEARELKARKDSMAAFLKIASHDLKNPLTVVQMGAFAIKIAKDGETRAMLADQIMDASRRARSLIDAYLEVCAVESGEPLRVSLGDVDARELVEQEITFLGAALSEERLRTLTFRNDVDAAPVRADQDKLRQIFSNLLSNACKYSPEGGVITVSSDAAPDGRIFTVRDEGVGISPEDQQKLFEQFQRVGDPRLASGTGLGLWVTRALVEAHGGRIWVDSERGRGSAFHFLVPEAAAPQKRLASLTSTVTDEEMAGVEAT